MKSSHVDVLVDATVLQAVSRAMRPNIDEAVFSPVYGAVEGVVCEIVFTSVYVATTEDVLHAALLDFLQEVQKGPCLTRARKNGNEAVDKGVCDALENVVRRAVSRSVEDVSNRAVYRTVAGAVDWTVYEAVWQAVAEDPPLPTFQGFLREVGPAE
jgi:hypothetical protein